MSLLFPMLRIRVKWGIGKSQEGHMRLLNNVWHNGVTQIKIVVVKCINKIEYWELVESLVHIPFVGFVL